MEQEPSPPDELVATDGEIRQVAVFLVVIGLFGSWFFRGWYVNGVMPAEWLMYVETGIGLCMLIWPSPWKHRIGALKAFGAKRPSDGE